MTGRTVPHDPMAEAAVLGAAMLSAHSLDVMIRDTNSSDFYTPSHQIVSDVLRDLWQSGIVHCDPILVADELKARGLLETVGGQGALVAMQVDTPAVANTARYAAVIVEYSMRRQIIRLGEETVNDAYGAGDVHGIITGFKDRIADMKLPVTDTEPSMTITDLLATDADYDWLVPGLIERRDRLILTGGEGGGKSTLMRQLAVTMAAGVHPFMGFDIEPLSVYYLDVENGFLQFKRKAETLVSTVRHRLVAERLRVDVRTGGLELTRRHDSSWLLGRMAANRPDVLITGPIYKLHAEDPNKEEPARKLSALFDEIRERFGCAILLETHSPHQTPGSKRPLRPVGASLWMRWPEFGYGLRKATDTTVYFEGWRGPRDERAWPVGLRRGLATEWPWMENYGGPPPPGDADHPGDEPDPEPF